MLICVFGTNSALLDAVVRILELAVEAAGRTTRSVRVSDVEELREVWSSSESKASDTLIVHANRATPQLTKLLFGSGAPIVICRETFTQLVGFHIANWDKGKFVHALRNATVGVVNIGELPQTDRSLVLGPDVLAKELDEILGSLLNITKLELTADNYVVAMEKITHGKGPKTRLVDVMRLENPQWVSPEEGLALLTESQRDYVQRLEHTYEDLLDRKDVQMYWPRHLFNYGDVPDDQLIGSVALVGPARCIFFGPYFNLPTGRWTIETEFEVINVQKDTFISADIYDGDMRDVVVARLPTKGIFAFSHEFTVEDNTRPIQVRLSLVQGALFGELLLIGSTVTRFH
jgi:hypothetical protein